MSSDKDLKFRIMRNQLASRKTWYLFLDESGNFDFSDSGTEYLIFTTASSKRPFTLFSTLDNFRHMLLEEGKDISHFHAVQDKQNFRGQILELIGNDDTIEIDAVIVEKRKTCPRWQDPKIIYPQMLGQLIRYVVTRKLKEGYQSFIVITDSIPINKKRKSIEKAVKETLADMLPKGADSVILHHPSSSHYGLQVADYCSWAIFKKWEYGNTEKHIWPYSRIRRRIKSEFDIFRTGVVKWY